MPWFAIYTKPRWEKKVNTLLANKGIESYCPVQTVQKIWSDRKKMVEVPLFTSYIFVNVSEDKQLEVRMTSGVVNFVYWLQKPAIIRDSEITALKDFVAKYDNITIEPLGVRPGDNIELESGIFKGQKALVKKVNKHTVELVLESLQMKLVVEKA